MTQAAVGGGAATPAAPAAAAPVRGPAAEPAALAEPTALAEPAGSVPRGVAADPVPASVRAAAAWSWRVLLIAAALALVVWVLSFVEVLVVSVAVALLLTVLLAPAVRWLTRVVRLPQGPASALAVLGLVAAVVGVVTLAGSSVARGFGALRDQTLAGFDELIDWLADGPLALTAGQLDSSVRQLTDWLSTNSGTLAAGALSVTTTVGHVAAGAFITLFCTFFFLHDGRRIWAWLVGLLPRATRERAHQAGRRGLVTLGGYTRTQILVAFVDAVGIGAGAAILGVPLVLPLATLVFVGSFIPVVGALVTGTVAILVALVAQGPVVALVMLGVVLLVQQVEGHLLQPLLMAHAVSLHPVAVLLAVAAGSFAAGIAGALFAVPLVAVLTTVILYLNGHDRFPALGVGDDADARGPSPAPVAADRTTLPAPR